MERFSRLFEKLDQTSSTNEKISYIAEYFRTAPPKDAVWGLFFLSGQRLKRVISSSLLRSWFLTYNPIPEWLFEECYSAVGDTAEVIALLAPKTTNQAKDYSLSEWLEDRILPLKDKNSDEKALAVISFWKELSAKERRTECFILNKILSGSFRVGVSQLLTLRALEEALEVDRLILAEKLLGEWKPSLDFFESLTEAIHPENKGHLQPYPFFLASAINALEELGDPSDWIAEWKWDGIRAQIIFRKGQVAIWSRGMELNNVQFPELVDAAHTMPEATVLDGEILAFSKDKPLQFALLQKRLGRKKVSKELIESAPIVFFAFDLLEYQGEDLRKKTLKQRRESLQKIIDMQELSPLIKLSKCLEFSTWEDLKEKREGARKEMTEGLVIKKLSSPYEVGRKRGSWWKYKLDPLSLDAILIYAQPGSGIRANLYTDYTFGLWSGEEIIPIAKAYSGLDQEEIIELDRWIRKNTEEKFGPVRKVKAFHVFEIAFEGIQASNRHKSKIALRFPRILRWRKDKPLNEANTLEDAQKLLEL